MLLCVAQVFGRAAKYSLFDPSKEMVFITMNKDEKEAGKAAVDVLGNQIGKTGGSWVMQVRCTAALTASCHWQCFHMRPHAAFQEGLL